MQRYKKTSKYANNYIIIFVILLNIHIFVGENNYIVI